MYALGFFSKHTTEKGLLVGVAAGFAALWYVASYTDIAWPWYCAIGGGVNMLVGWLASRLLTGRQAEWHPLTIVGQRRQFAAGSMPTRTRTAGRASRQDRSRQLVAADLFPRLAAGSQDARMGGLSVETSPLRCSRSIRS
jgi:hypothetical protein